MDDTARATMAAQRAAANRAAQIQWAKGHARTGYPLYLRLAEACRQCADAQGALAACYSQPQQPEPRPSFWRRVGQFFGVTP
jgi:hypothetical protein